MQINGEVLHRLRFAAGLTQTELAKRVGASPSMLSLVEGGRRNAGPALVRSIADALGITVDELCDPDDLEAA